jgi:molecular chaperone Hsp33
LAANRELAAGLLIQRLPVLGQGNLAGRLDRDANEDQIGRNEDFNRIAMLAATLQPQELLGLSADEVLHRLFWEEPITRFEPLRPRFACKCSRQRVTQMLRSLGQAEVQSIIAEQTRVEVACEFCGVKYRFDAVDAAQLFAAGTFDQPPSSSLQ